LILRIDAQLSPDLAPCIEENFGVTARPIRDLGLLGAKDKEIFEAARDEGAVVPTKDRDFVILSSASVSRRTSSGSRPATLPTRD
jgi:predicted nuclease of predicted toxin-antitoxin system